jgi:hypothetical protein
LARLWRRSRIALIEAERKLAEALEGKKEKLPVKSAPIDLDHTTEDPTVRRIGGDVDSVSLEELYENSRGEQKHVISHV